MAGSYTKKEYGITPEEQTLLKDSNGTRIVPKGAEPVHLSPGWEGTGRTEDELNFKGITMNQAHLQLHPPRDRLNIVFFIMLLHGIGALMPWNMFITAKLYFDYKFSPGYTSQNLAYASNFLSYVTFASQVPNVMFSWLNLFAPLGGNLTTRVIWSIFSEVVLFVFTVVMAMIDTSGWPDVFFALTIVTVVALAIANGIYQNSVFGMAANLPGKYTGAVVLGSNISGTLTAVISLITQILSPNPRTAAIYYFITALFVLLACFDTYFALPINRFYRYHEEVKQRELEVKTSYGKNQKTKTPYWKIFKQCKMQCFNVFFVFFVTLSIFPAVQSNIKQIDKNFIISETYYVSVMCYLTFNVTAMLGSFIASLFQWPKRSIIIPILLRVVYIPLFLLCNYDLENRNLPLLINSDVAYLIIGITMGLSSGYFSSVSMMHCSSVVEPQYASVAGMLGAAFLVTGIFSGILASFVMPYIA